MFEEQKFVEKGKMHEFQTDVGHQMDNLYASTIQRLEERTEKLQESRFSLAGVQHKDGKEMREVKFYQERLTTLMRKSISKDAQGFQQELLGMEELYEKLTFACTQYIDAHKHPFTASGKARLHLVKGTLSLAKQEEKKLREKATELHQIASQRQEDLVWGNVLGIIRGSDFDLDKMDGLDMGGAATSEVQIIKSGGKMFFFKQEERLESAEDAYTHTYVEKCTDKKDKKIYMELERIVRKQIPGGLAIDALMVMEPELAKDLKAADAPEELNRLCNQVIRRFLERHRVDVSGLDWNDRRTQEILREVLPKLDMWATRAEVCRTVGIGRGESLSKRNVLTSRMAIVCKMPQLMALSNTATLHHSGLQKKEGIVMEQAKGMEHMKVITYAQEKGKKVVYTPEAMRQFSCMQLFDTVCGQIDRHYSNRFVTMVEEEDRIIITGAQGIDHDMSFGKRKYKDVSGFPVGALPGFEDHGKCAIPALDEELVELLRNMTKEDLTYYLGDQLEEEYIEAMWDRLSGVVSAIDRMAGEDPGLLVKKEDWNTEVAKRFVGLQSTYVFVEADEIAEEMQQQK